MKRRDFLKRLGIGTAATVIPVSALAHTELFVKQSVVEHSSTVQSITAKDLWPEIKKWYDEQYARENLLTFDDPDIPDLKVTGGI